MAMMTDQPAPADDEISIDALLLPLLAHWRHIIIGSLAVGLVALGVTYLIRPTFTARVALMPPQQTQTMSAAALASISSLAGLASGNFGVRNPVDQYISLLQSRTIGDRLIDRFELMREYDVQFRFEAHRQLRENVRIFAGKRDGILVIEVDDTDPARSAAIANAHVDELQQLTTRLAMTEAQQRRAFFEQHLNQAREDLLAAQLDLESGGFNRGALRAEPRASAEGYAKLKAELTAAEVRLTALRASLADSTPEVKRQILIVEALRQELAKSERADAGAGQPGYVARYREFKYRETLFEIFARQYEAARVDESREGAILQVVDTAIPPERKSRPKRALTAIASTLVSMLAMSVYVVMRHRWRIGGADPATVERRRRRRAALAGQL